MAFIAFAYSITCHFLFNKVRQSVISMVWILKSIETHLPAHRTNPFPSLVILSGWLLSMPSCYQHFNAPFEGAKSAWIILAQSKFCVDRSFLDSDLWNGSRNDLVLAEISWICRHEDISFNPSKKELLSRKGRLLKAKTVLVQATFSLARKEISVIFVPSVS